MVEMSFEPRVHGDGHDFDGPGGTTAHAFYPPWGGNVHFDGEEDWVVNDTYGKKMNIYSLNFYLILSQLIISQRVILGICHLSFG